ncbi:Z1 domain-containing protein [Herbaspirillum rubrisubalbicans]|uniref:Z1 domain-containing protein n=1 Tax=Herbaspirillum rubrisubalbicans TaxID=80842 RepID=UPI00192B11D4
MDAVRRLHACSIGTGSRRRDGAPELLARVAGRGYRPGYDDLFRIWMNSDAQNWYAHIANAVAELRTDFRRMSADRLPPSRFGIRVSVADNPLSETWRAQRKD